MNIAVYPGSFDPVTYGHIDIIKRGAETFDKVIVAILENPHKRPLFSIEERKDFLICATSDIPNVQIESFDGLVANYMDQVQAKVIIKGLRAVSDFEYELKMASINKKLAPHVETLFMMANNRYSFLSSSVVKEVAQFGGDISDLVTQEVLEAFKKVYPEKTF